MAILRLNARESAVLGAYGLNADTPLKQIRDATGYRDHTIRYTMSRLIARGLVRRRTFVNIYPLGFQDHAIFFALASHSQKQRQGLITYLKSSASVSWLTQLGGDFHFGMALVAKNLSQVTDFLDRVSDVFPGMFFDKSLSVRVSLTIYPKKYLSPVVKKNKRHTSLFFGTTGESVEIDNRDHLILNALEQAEFTSDRDLARKLSLPHSSLELRLKQLRNKKIIVGEYFHLDVTRLGVQKFILLVYVRGISSTLNTKLHEFSAQHKHITYIIRCVGSWDFEVGAEVEHGAQVTNIVQELCELCGPEINTVRVLPLLEHLKQSNYPFPPPSQE